MSVRPSPMGFDVAAVFALPGATADLVVTGSGSVSATLAQWTGREALHRAVPNAQVILGPHTLPWRREPTLRGTTTDPSPWCTSEGGNACLRGLGAPGRACALYFATGNRSANDRLALIVKRHCGTPLSTSGARRKYGELANDQRL